MRLQNADANNIVGVKRKYLYAVDTLDLGRDIDKPMIVIKSKLLLTREGIKKSM